MHTITIEATVTHIEERTAEITDNATGEVMTIQHPGDLLDDKDVRVGTQLTCEYETRNTGTDNEQRWLVEYEPK